MDKFQNKYRIPSARLQGYDYGANGCYFVTICTKNKEYYFGEIVNGKLHLSEIGEIAQQYWLEIPKHFPFVILDEFAVMPNHIHGILFFYKNDEIQYGDNARCDGDMRCDGDTRCRDAINRVSTGNGGITGIHNPMLHQNLGRVLRWFKGRVSFECGKIDTHFAWQERFHDRIIRYNNGLENVREYVFNNPANWNDDELNDKKT